MTAQSIRRTAFLPRAPLVAPRIRPAAWLLEIDRRYRERQHVARMSDDRLADAGLQRDAAGRVLPI